MRVKKRNGRLEEYNVEKIHKMVGWACEGINGVSISDIEMNAELSLYDKIPTKEIHNILIQSAANLISEEEPNYQFVAARLLNITLRKDVWGSNQPPRLYDHIKNCIKADVYTSEILDWYTADEIHKISTFIKHDYDDKFTYAGLQQMIDKYLVKNRNTNEIYETPQFVYILIAMILFQKYEDRIERIKECYEYFATHKISLPTPIMAGVRTKIKQFASCCLVDVDDSLGSIFSSVDAVGRYTARRSGIGLNIGRVRPINSPIRGGEVIHTGLIPYLKLFESTVKATSQNGLRGGSATTHVPWWHPEIMDVLILKNNAGTDDNRVRKLDYSIQLDKVFYERLVKKEDVTLFSPAECPGLYEAFGSPKFKELYEEYEKRDDLQYCERISAIKLMQELLRERLETGRIYIMHMDNCWQNGSWNVKPEMSNLCVAPETLLLTKDGYIPIAELDGKNIEIWNGHEWSLSPVRKTGTNQKLVKVVLSNGVELECTEYHEWYIQEGYPSKNKNGKVKKKTRDLKIGEKLIKFNFPVIDGIENFKEPYTHGFFCADGATGGKTYKEISLYGEKQNLISHLAHSSTRLDRGSVLVANIPNDIADKYAVPLKSSIQIKLDWLAGLFDGDGSVVKKSKHAIILSSSKPKFIKKVQLLLNTLGVSAKISKCFDAKNMLLPDGKGGKKEYFCNAAYSLLINATNLHKLYQLGFKTNRLKINPESTKFSCSHFIKIVDIIDEGRYDDTYCVGEPLRNKAVFNGVLTGNCQEILHPTKPLQSWNDPEAEIGVCILSALNLLNIKNDEELERSCDIIVRLLDELIDYQEYPVEAAERFTRNKRSLGVGITNVAALLATNKLSYNDQGAVDLLDEWMEKIQYYLLLSSNKLAEEKEPCPDFALTRYSEGKLPMDWANENAKKLTERKPVMDWEGLRQKIKDHGLRHTTLTAIMPCESSSVIQNSTNGIEPVRRLIAVKKAKNGTLKQVVPRFNKYKNYYDLAFSLGSNDGLINIIATLQKWVDMSISANNYYNYTDYENDHVPLSVMMKDLLTCYKLGVKTLYYCNTPDGSSDATSNNESCAGGACSI